MAFTYFFRDYQTLDAIRVHAIPYLKTKQYIDIWDAGCASGQEPFSLSMLINECMGYMLFRNVRILATDIDESNQFERIIIEGKSEPQRLQVIKMFHDSLTDGGFFVMEQTQKLPQKASHLFEPIVSNA